MDILKENIRFKIIDSFIENFTLVHHHLNSYNKFITSYLREIVFNEEHIVFEDENEEIVSIKPVNIFKSVAQVSPILVACRLR